MTFLTTLLEALGAQSASLLRLDREAGRWVVEREVPVVDETESAARELPAAGHPLTWCVREDLIVQLPASELSGDRSGQGWALAGPVPGRRSVLVLRFGGAPPSRARRAVRPALDHLGALEGREAATRGR